MVRLPNLGTRREVPSFLVEMYASSKQRAIIPVSVYPVNLSCGYDSLPSLFCRSSNMTAHSGLMIDSGDLTIQFGRDWPYFDQTMWPITLENNG